MIAFQTKVTIRKPTHDTPNLEISLHQSVRLPDRWNFFFHNMAGHTIEIPGQDPAAEYRSEEGYIDRDKLPRRWEICYCCQGEGKSSAYLGDYTMSEFHEAFDPDEAEDYFAGRYDKACDPCKGSGKVKAVDYDALPEDVRKMVERMDQEEADYRAEQAAERRMGC